MKTHPWTRYITHGIDRGLASLLLILCVPIFLLNVVLAKVRRQSTFEKEVQLDALHRPVFLLYLRLKYFRSLGLLLNVARGDLGFYGLELLGHEPYLKKIPDAVFQQAQCYKAGIFSLPGLRRATGLVQNSECISIEQQIASLTPLQYYKNVLKAIFTRILVPNTTQKEVEAFHLFGLKIDNQTMSDAIRWTLKKRKVKECDLGFFANVNTVNLACDDSALRVRLNTCARMFADGSGVRLGAKHLGVQLRDNVNGTDFLPILCEKAQASGASIFLMGAKDNVAERAAKQLKSAYPSLKIAGYHHGYFDKNGQANAEVVEKINRSNAQILLVGMGTPEQENWLLDNRAQLNVHTALAVGGLFDFYSGDISRAPLWMRETGLEWVWRLIQEPGAKWKRYVLGNPLYLYRLWATQH